MSDDVTVEARPGDDRRVITNRQELVDGTTLTIEIVTSPAAWDFHHPASVIEDRLSRMVNELLRVAEEEMG